MASRASWLSAIVGAVVLGGMLSPAAAQEKPKKISTMVVRYVGHQDDGKFRYLGRPVMLLAVEPIDGGRPVELVVPNTGWGDPKNDKYDPIPQVSQNVRNLKRGDVIKIEVEQPAQQQGRPLVREAKRYTVKPGEGEPNTYVFKSNFRNKEGRSNFMAVVLSRFDEQTTVAVQQHRDKEGDMVSDPAILDLLGKLKAGELVEADIKDAGRTPVLTSLERYAPRLNGKFVKMTEAEVDGQKVPAVELERQGKPVTATVAGKMQGKRWTPDGRVLAAAKRLKPDTAVTFRARDDGGKLVLKEIEPAAKDPADSAAAASRGGRPAKMDKEKDSDK